MPWCGLETTLTPVTLISLNQQLAENDGYHFWHENLLLGILVLCLCERSTGALEKLVSHQEWSLIYTVYISRSLYFLINIFVIIYIFQTISIHFNPAICKLYWLFIICVNIYSYSCQWWLASLLVSNWLSLPLLYPTITPSVLWSFCPSLLWNPLSANFCTFM